MWFVMERMQSEHAMSERLLDAVNLAGSPASAQAHWGQQWTVRELVSDGADVNRPHGRILPLQAAVLTGHEATVRELLQLGAKVNLVDGYGRSALHYAVEKSAACVAALLAEGAEVDARDSQGNTPLHWAAYKGHDRCLRLLLDKGADVDAVNDAADSALSWAAQRGHLAAIRVLLDYNARPDSFNRSGSSPLSRILEAISIGIGSTEEELCMALLLRALGQFRLRESGDEEGLGAFGGGLAQEADIRRLLHPHASEPRSLQEQSRWGIRRALGSGLLLPKVNRLPLPPGLRDFILLSA